MFVYIELRKNTFLFCTVCLKNLQTGPFWRVPRDSIFLSSVQEKAYSPSIMRLCLASSITEDSDISPDSSVNEGRRIIAQKQQIAINSVHIIFKGKVLRKEKQLKDYGSLYVVLMIFRHF